MGRLVAETVVERIRRILNVPYHTVEVDIHRRLSDGFVQLRRTRGDRIFRGVRPVRVASEVCGDQEPQKSIMNAWYFDSDIMRSPIMWRLHKANLPYEHRELANKV